MTYASNKLKRMVISIFKKDKEDPGNDRSASFTSVLGKAMKQLILETSSRHVKDRKVIGSKQDASTKCKSCFTNPITFYDEMTGLVNEKKAEDIAYLDLSKDFNSVSHKILIEKVMKYGLYEQTVRWIARPRQW